MPYTLVIGQKNYSSWSMRAWLLLKAVGASFDEISIELYQAQSREAVRAHGGQTGQVPVLIDKGNAIWDTMAIFEYVYEDFPSVWPADRYDRARARSYSGELHSGFSALRSTMPVNTRARGRTVEISDAVASDIARVTEIWTKHGSGSTWLFGEFSAADIMFAPVATRFQTYGVALEGPAKDYMARLLQQPLVAEWLRLGQQETSVIQQNEVGM